MLSGILKEHQQSQLKQKEILEKKKQEAIQASAQLTETLVDHLNVGVAQAYLNERKIDIEARKLQQQASVFSKNAKDFLKLIEGLNSSLKELGDVETWSKHIECDAKLISAALECAYKAHQENKPSTSEQP